MKRKARLQSAKKEEEKARMAEVEGLVEMLGNPTQSLYDNHSPVFKVRDNMCIGRALSLMLGKLLGKNSFQNLSIYIHYTYISNI